MIWWIGPLCVGVAVGFIAGVAFTFARENRRNDGLDTWRDGGDK